VKDPHVIDGQRVGELLRHTAVYGLGPVLGQAAGFVLLPLYTNLLSPTDYGTLEILVLASTFLNVFLGLQTVTQIHRMYHGSDDPDERRRVVSTAVIFTGVLTTAAVLPADLFRHELSHALFGTGAHGHLLRLGLWSVVTTNVFAAALAYLQARRMSGAFTALSVAQLVATLSVNLVLVAWLRRGVEGILLSQLVVGASFALGTAGWVLTRTGVAVSAARIRDIVLFGLPLIGWSLAVFVVNAADRLALSALGSLTDVGVYSLANRFGASLLIFVVAPFSNYCGSERFRLARQPGGRALLARIFTYFFTVLCATGLGVSALGNEVVRLMASEQFWAAAPMVPILVSTLVVPVVVATVAPRCLASWIA
jgi:O-antigen/teichoic acid export membrane protein